MKNLLSEKVHLMCYRICVRALTAIITYHDRCVCPHLYEQYKIFKSRPLLHNSRVSLKYMVLD